MKINLFISQDFQQPKVEELLKKLNQCKAEAAAKGDEEVANNCWGEIEALNLNSLYVGAFDKIKNKKYRDAWCDFEQCEIKAKCLTENSSEDFLTGYST